MSFSTAELILLADLTGQPVSYWWTRTEADLPADQVAEWCRRRARWQQGEPLAYIMGHMDWRGQRYQVSPAVLIPRPETELMVDLVRTAYQPGDRLVDVGTGSGCIAIALSLELNQPVQAVDISPAALAVARHNAQRLGAAVELTESDLLSQIHLDSGCRYLITANLPYLAEAEWADLDDSVRRYEPRLALVAAEAGLALYHRLIDDLRRQAVDFMLCGEIDPAQEVLLRTKYPGISFEDDYTHRPRFFILANGGGK